MPGGRSIWVGSPVTDHLRALAEAGQEHLHLHARRVLRLVEDDEGVGQRAAAHEGERRDLDDAGLEIALDLLRRQHVVERVVERTQIGIDLLAHVAGQEAEPLAGLDGGARQDDALDEAALQAMGGVGDGEIGLAGAGRADAEHEIGLLERPDVGALHRRARLDDAAARARSAPARRPARLSARAWRIRPSKSPAPIGSPLATRAYRAAPARRAPCRRRRFRTGQGDDVAVGVRLDAEAVLDQGQIAVVLAEQLR